MSAKNTPWTKIHSNARNHPKVVRLAAAVGVTKINALGILVAIWLWACDYAPDGTVPETDAALIEGAVDWTGPAGSLVKALEDCKLLDHDDGDLSIHNACEYSGSYGRAKSRRRERKAKKRKEQGLGVARQSADSRATVALIGEKKEPSTSEREPSTGEPLLLAPAPMGKEIDGHVHQVWAAWRKHHPQVAAELKRSSDHWRLIAARIRSGRSVAELTKAIEGIHLDPWEEREKYLDLEHAFSKKNIERFMVFADAPPPSLTNSRVGGRTPAASVGRATPSPRSDFLQDLAASDTKAAP